MNDGDWICSDANCGNINFARRNACYRCNKERPDGGKPVKKKLGTEIGKSAAEKSRGLFNADDWQCNKCANVNWARRQTCNVCNAPKFGEVEARTGYGGGYNERGVVEYRRREPSSDDEYDEFGRKKRKRKPETKSETQTKVGITEGAVFKNLTPTKSQMELNVDKIVMPAPQQNLSNVSNDDEYNKGSLSDGSVCDVSPFTVSAFKKYQTNNTSSYRLNNTLPQYKTNGYQYRKRHASNGDKEHTGSSGYETGSKRAKHESSESPVFKSYKKPVMENRVTSTNDVVIKFSGATPAETFQVTYTVEERVKAAAFAIAYNNCKISTDKFEAIFDKPAPDFKTIFAWRQRLLTTGCLVDSHLEQGKGTYEKLQNIPTETTQNVQKVALSKANEVSKVTNIQGKEHIVKRLPNPDEIVLSSDNEEEFSKSQTQSKSLMSQQRCESAETLVLPGLGDIQKVGSAEDIRSVGRSHSSSTHRRTRSSSSGSRSSRSHDSDYERCESKSTKSRTSIIRATKSTRNSVPDSDSESISYNSAEENFLSRKFGENRKVRRKVKKRGPMPNTEKPPLPYSTNNVQPFLGYSTVKPPEQIAALAHGNIYTSNLRNMKPPQKIFSDIDTCSTEYVPTRIGATAKKNYQQFKANVRKTGFWAKANGAAISKRNINVKDSISGLGEPPIPPKEIANTSFPIPTPCYTQVQKLPTSKEDFTKDDFDSFKSNEQPFEKTSLKTKSNRDSQQRMPPKVPEDTDRVFAIAQSNSSINPMDILLFDNGQQGDNSPETNNLENHNTIKKPFETQWDEDDDALYGDSETCENSVQNLNQIPSPPNVGPQSPTDMLYEANNDNQSTPIDQTILQQKKEMLLGLLKDIQTVSSDNEFISPLKNTTPKKCSSRSSVETVVSHTKKETNSVVTNLFPRPESIPPELSEEVLRLSESPKRISNDSKNKKINPSKQVKILECVTIRPGIDKQSPKKRSQVEDCDRTKNVRESVDRDIQRSVSPGLDCVKEKHADIPLPKEQPPQPNSHVDLSNLLAGINTNTLLLALQNLQQLTQSSNNSANTSQNNEEKNDEEEIQPVETINLTNDEEWERETNRDESIERQLEKLDGDPSATPFLSDIFDPGPVIPPPTGAKLNINLKLPEQKLEEQKQNLDEDAPVIGNFKSFALPKPIMLNRLKLAVKPNDKAAKKSGEGRRRKKKKKSSTSRDDDGEEEDEDEESGDEADLSKYDLWGSDEEQDKSKAGSGAANKSKEGESSKKEDADNGKTASPGSKNSKRSRSSSTSSSSSSSSSSSHSSTNTPKNKFDDFNLNSERESSPKGRKSGSRSRSRSPRSRSSGAGAPTRRKSRDSRSAGESRPHESRDKEYTRDRERRERSRGSRDDRKERRYSRDGNHYSGRSRQR